ncbi:hypothetical protein C1141_20755, partial [Vibrio agarivorans]
PWNCAPVGYARRGSEEIDHDKRGRTMSKPLCREITEPDQLRPAADWVVEMAGRGLRAGPVTVTLGRPSRSQIQNEKFHAMISDIHRQCFRVYSAEGMKAVLVNQFALEMAEQGTPLAHPGETVWDWKHQSPVYVRPTTTRFTKPECAAFIEWLYATGIELGVTWSEKALAVYAEYREATS